MKPLPLPLLLVLLLLPWLNACGGGGDSPVVAAASPGPALAVERFLQAANANDLDTMVELFGSADQTIAELDGRSMAEERMYVLATLLRHDDFAILSQQPVPGRLREAAELRVELRRGDRRVVVPHTVVRKSSGGWIVERVDIEELTQQG